jgi:lipopolysaccharide export system protein LptA
MNGDKLTVNLTLGTSKLDGVKQQGTQRVKGVFVPSSMDKDKDKKGDRPARKKQSPPN